MKKIVIHIIIILCLFLCSCDFTKWENKNDLVGEWISCSGDGAKIVFYEDGTCQVIDVPKTIYVPYWGTLTTLKWEGTTSFIAKLSESDIWNFNGYWNVEEEILRSKSNGVWGKKPRYHYTIVLSPYQEMTRGAQNREQIIDNNNSDAFGIKINAWTESFLPPACVHYLYSEYGDPDDMVYIFEKKNK